MRDVVSQDYGWAPNTTGIALVFTGYDAFAARCPRAAQIVLDILADQSRSAALFGRRLMCLVQSNDPDIKFAPVGATPGGVWLHLPISRGLITNEFWSHLVVLDLECAPG